MAATVAARGGLQRAVTPRPRGRIAWGRIFTRQWPQVSSGYFTHTAREEIDPATVVLGIGGGVGP